VSAHIPTLEEVIAWAAHQPRLDITFFDVKLPPAELGLLPAFLRRVDACVERFRPRFRIVLESAHPEIIDALREAQVRYDTALDVEPSAGVVWDCDEYSAVRAAIRHGCLIATPQKPRSITRWPFETHHRIVAADTLEMRKYNDERTSGPALRICPFTINEPDEMRALLELGVSGMQSDRPALLKQTLDEVCSTTRKHDAVADVRSREASQ
jgi:glycerophosphoryl diester phosphodiesterase